MTTAMPNPTASTQSVAFASASSVESDPLTSGIPTPTMTIGMAPTPATATMGSGTSSAKSGIAAPMRTGDVGVATPFAGAGAWLNL